MLAITISSPAGSSDISPKVSPENMAENMINITISTHCTAYGIGSSPSPEGQLHSVELLIGVVEFGDVLNNGSVTSCAEQNK